MGFEVSLGPCLEARVFGSWKGGGDERSTGGREGPAGAFITASSAAEPPAGTRGEAQR